MTALKKQLKSKVGRDVAVNLTVDPSILGGLIVKIGSQMIDSSIKTRLNTLAVRKRDHFTGLNIVETVDTGDAVPDRKNLTDFRHLSVGAKASDLGLDNL